MQHKSKWERKQKVQSTELYFKNHQLVFIVCNILKQRFLPLTYNLSDEDEWKWNKPKNVLVYWTV